MISPEDSPKWNEVNQSSADYRMNRKCLKCKVVIVLYHCRDTGCPWCRQCAPNSDKERK